MSNLEIIANKISSIEKYLALLAGFLSYSEKEIKNDTTISGAVERYAYLMVQTTIDLAEATISYRSLRQPTTMAEAFVILKENNIIDNDLCDNLIKMVGFRNVLAHDYEELNFNILYSVIHQKTSEIKKFIALIEKALKI